MKIIVYSDIHANAEAFVKVLSDIEGRHPDLLVSLGDVVGYGADPGRCIELVDGSSDIRIIGNHDLAASEETGGERFNLTAALSIEWTRNNLADAHRSKLKEYNPVQTYDDCLFTHASPISPLDWEYVYTIGQAGTIFGEFRHRFIFVGHTHIPGVISYNEEDGATVETGTSIRIEPDKRYLINPGSVGQPRDGKSEASYGSLDLDADMIRIHRVEYDIHLAQSRIRSKGLPESLASRLATAR